MPDTFRDAEVRITNGPGIAERAEITRLWRFRGPATSAGKAVSASRDRFFPTMVLTEGTKLAPSSGDTPRELRGLAGLTEWRKGL